MPLNVYRSLCCRSLASRSAAFALSLGRRVGRSGRWTREYQDSADHAEYQARRAFAALLGMEG